MAPAAGWPAEAARDARLTALSARLAAASAGAWRTRAQQTGLVQDMWGGRAVTGGRDPRESAERFLQEYGELLGMRADGANRLELHRTVSAVGERFVYQQMECGLPVLGRTALVGIDSRLRVQAAASRFEPLEKVAGLDGKVAREAAIRTAREATGSGGVLRMAPVTERAIHATGRSGLAVWRVLLAARAPMADWEVLVSCESGQVLRRRNLICTATGTGRVFDPNPVVTLGTRALSDNNDADGAQFANAYKTVPLQRLDGTGLLRGSYADVYTQPGEFSGGGTRTRANESSLNFFYNRSDDRFEEVNLYYHLDAIQDYIQRTTTMTNVNNRRIFANAHEGDYLNAFYSSFTRSLYFGDGDGGPDLAEDADVSVHEYGHAIQDNQVPGWGQQPEGGAMGEGFSDYLAGVYSSEKPVNAGGNDPDPECMGEWAILQFDTCLRRLDGTKHYPEDIVGEVHDDGEIWSACLWQIREAFGNAVSLRIVLESHFLLDINADFKAGANAIITADQSVFAGIHVPTIESIFRSRGILDPTTPPIVTRLIPDSLDNDAERPLIIEGSRFDGATQVTLRPSIGTGSGAQIVSSTGGRIDALVPAGLAPGGYTVQISASGGTNSLSPLLTIQGVDDRSNTCSELSTADRLTIGGVGTTAAINFGGDRDLYILEISEPGTYVIGVVGLSLADSFVQLLDDDCTTMLGQDDDAGPDRSSRLEYTFTQPGTYYVRVKSYDDTGFGTYRVAVGGSAPAVEIRSITASWPRLSVGQAILSTVTVSNTGQTAVSFTTQTLTVSNSRIRPVPLFSTDSLAGGGASTSFTFVVTGASLGQASITSALLNSVSLVDLTPAGVAANRATSAVVTVETPTPTLVLETISPAQTAVGVGEVFKTTVTLRNEGTGRVNINTPRLIVSASELTASRPTITTSLDGLGARHEFTFDVTGASVGLGRITSATFSATSVADGKAAPITTNTAIAANIIVGTPIPKIRIASIEVSRAAVNIGQSMTATVTFVNDGSGPANVSSSSLVITNARLSGLTSNQAFTISGIGGTASVTFALQGASAGTTIVTSATVSATNPAFGNSPVGITSNSATSRTVAVQTPATLAVSFLSPSHSAVTRRQGNVTVRVGVTHTGTAAAGAAASELLATLRIGADSAGYTISPVAGQPTALAAGASAVLTYTVRVLDGAPLGVTAITADVRAKDFNTLAPVTAASTQTASWTVRDTAALSVGPVTVSTTIMLRGQSVAIANVKVSNTASPTTGNDAVGVQVRLKLNGSTDGYLVRSVPGGPSTLVPGQTAIYKLAVDALDTAPRGPTVVAADVSASDALSEQPAPVTYGPPGQWTVLVPGSLTVAQVTRSAPLVSRGQQGAFIRAAVSNPGDLPVAFGASPRWSGSASGYTVTSAAMNATQLSGGTSALLTFAVDVLAEAPLGLASITVDAHARNTVDGQPAPVSNPVTSSWAVLSAAALSVDELRVERTTLVRGQRGTSVEARVTNTGSPGSGAAANGVRAQLLFDGEEAHYVVTPDAANAVELAAGQSRVLTFAVEAGPAAPLGPTTVTAIVTASDVHSGLVTQTRRDLADAWVVVALAELRVTSVVPARSTLTLGERGVRVTARVENTGDTVAEELLATLRFNGAASGYLVTASPGNAAELSGGATIELTLTVDTSAVTPLGATTLTVELAAREQLLGAPVEVRPGASSGWNVLGAAQLSAPAVAASRSKVARGETGVGVEVTVSNEGETGVEELAAELEFFGTKAGYRVTPAPGNAPGVGAGRTVTLTYSVDVLADALLGDTPIAAVVRATEVATGRRLALNAQQTARWVVLAPGVVRLDALAVSRTVVSAGQRGVGVQLALANPGQTALTGLAASLRFNGSTDGYSVTALPGNATGLAAGKSAVLTFSVDVLPAATSGRALIGAAVAATDAAAGTPAPVAGAVAAAWLVQRPARLALRSLTAVPSALTPGEIGNVVVVLENQGEAPTRLTSLTPISSAPSTVAISGSAVTADIAAGRSFERSFPTTALSTGSARIASVAVDAFDVNTGGSLTLIRDNAGPDPLVSVGLRPAATLTAAPRAYISDGAGAVLNFDAGGSLDPLGGPLTYAWAQVSGPAVALTPGSTSVQRVVAAAPGQYSLRVTAITSIGLASSAGAIVQVGTNGSPTVSIAPPVRALAGDRVRVQGAATDPDSDPLAYRWEQSSGAPALEVDLASTTAPVLVLTARSPGGYGLRLTVTDTHGASAATQAQLTVDSPPTVTVTYATGVNFVSLPLSPFTADGHGYDCADLLADTGGSLVSRLASNATGYSQFAPHLPEINRPFMLEPGSGYVLLSSRPGALVLRGKLWPPASTQLILRPPLALVSYPRGVPTSETSRSLLDRAGSRFVARTRARASVAGDRLEIHLQGLTPEFVPAPGEAMLLPVKAKRTIVMPEGGGP